MYFATNLHYLRRKRKLSQSDLGDLIGVDYPAISKYERGVATPKLDTISKLAQLFGVSIEQLRNTDLTKSVEPAVAEPTSAYQRQHLLTNPTKPAKHKMQVIVELDGTSSSLERVFARLIALNDAVAETD